MNVSSVVNHYPTANKGFITTLGSTISAGATTVPLTSVSGLTNATVFVGLIEPGTANEQEFTGTVDTAGVQITGVKWTDGSNIDHTAGVTIVDYVSATGQNMQTKAHLVSHDQDGTLKAGAVDVTAVVADAILSKAKLDATMNTELNTGWVAGVLPSVSTVTANGNRSYDITFGSSVASTLSSGMRLRTTRTVAAPTYMGGLMNGSSHYFTKTTPTSTLSTVTNNFTLTAEYQPTAYQLGYICGRGDVTSANGLFLRMNADGTVSCGVSSGGAANYRIVSTYQSLPLNKKTDIVATWTGGTVTISFDGTSVPVAAAVTNGTAPTTAGTGGDFSVGRWGALSASYAAGYISGVGVFDAVLSASTIKAMQGQALTGSETNCIGAWSLNNTAVNQQAPGTNDLTATGGVGYSNKSPYGNDGVSSTLDYALVMSVSGSTATVQVPEGCTIPTSGGVTSVAYSVQGNPYGWPTRDRFRLEAIALVDLTTASPANGTWYSSNLTIYVPSSGNWFLGSEYILIAINPTNQPTATSQLSSSSSGSTDVRFGGRTGQGATNSNIETSVARRNSVVTTAPTTYYLIFKVNTASHSVVGCRASTGECASILYAEPAGL